MDIYLPVKHTPRCTCGDHVVVNTLEILCILYKSQITTLGWYLHCFNLAFVTGQSIVSPVETLFKSMHDVFACYSTPAVTYKPIEAKQFDDFSIVDALALAFDDPVFKICKRYLRTVAF